MATITQDNRLLKLKTPLGADYLLIDEISIEEGLSKLYSARIAVAHHETRAESLSPTIVKPEDILGKKITVEINQRGEAARNFSGIVTDFRQGNRNAKYSFYEMTVRPEHWLLTQRIQSRIFQHKSVPEIIKEVLEGFDLDVKTRGRYEPRVYCVQYRESDFDFVSRLMEEEGIFYFFSHDGDAHRMVIADEPGQHLPCPSKSSIPFATKTDENEGFVAKIVKWSSDFSLRTGKVTVWDHNFQLPRKKLDDTVQRRDDHKYGPNDKLEFYDFPAGYARKYDGIDDGTGEIPSELEKIFQDNKKTARIMMQSLESRYRKMFGEADCSSMTSGYRFELTGHPASELNGSYVLTSISHRAVQSPTYDTGEELDEAYINSFTCIPLGLPYRPERITPKPVVRGTQTAYVVGPAGEEIYTDKYSRVKVQFHWDREGQNDANSSCWVRVSTLWAGKQWGVIHIPRIGQEVIVDFIEGDPDQPIIVGSVYNPDTMPPYQLPQNKTQSGVKSRSSKEGTSDNFNEFRFEDKKGSEEVYLHAEKDYNIVVEHDESRLVMHDRMKTVNHDETSVIKHDRTETVQNNETITIWKNRTETVGENETINIGKDRTHNVAGEQAKTVGKNDKLKVTQSKKVEVGDKYELIVTNEINESSKKIVITAGVELVLQGPGGQIKIHAGGVDITGVLVKIN